MNNMNNNMEKYRHSRYNYAVDYNGKKLLYNGLSGAGICMTKEEYEKIKPLMENLETFQRDYPEDFNHLLNLGYVIEDSFDEIRYIRYKNNEAVFLNRAYTIVINPTLECNFRCWYCYEDHVDGKMSDDTVEAVKKHIEHKVINHEITSLHLSWFGGEPLLYFNEIIYPISLFAKELCENYKVPFSNHVTSNAYLITDSMIEDMRAIVLNSFQITLDGSRERHDKIRNNRGLPSYDIIMKNINLLCKNISNVNVIMRVNYDDVTLKTNSAKQILEDVSPNNRSKVNINMQRVWQTYKSQEENILNEEVVDFIKEAKKAGFCGVEYIAGLSVRKYYNCYVSRYNHIEINYDGMVYKCTARGYDVDRSLGKMTSSGLIEFNEKKLSCQYSKSTFDNEMCLECMYLPLCWGPCPQKLLEIGDKDLPSICFFRAFEYPISKLIIDKYEVILANKNIEL